MRDDSHLLQAQFGLPWDTGKLGFKKEGNGMKIQPLKVERNMKERKIQNKGRKKGKKDMKDL